MGRKLEASEASVAAQEARMAEREASLLADLEDLESAHRRELEALKSD